MYNFVGRHKIVILDEADSMTEAAQQALRRTMEIYSNTTRFALACNNSEKIIEPIQSRCAMLRYSKLTDPQILAKLLDVCEKEKVEYTEDGMEAVIFTSQVYISLHCQYQPISSQNCKREKRPEYYYGYKKPGLYTKSTEVPQNIFLRSSTIK